MNKKRSRVEMNTSKSHDEEGKLKKLKLMSLNLTLREDFDGFVGYENWFSFIRGPFQVKGSKKIWRNCSKLSHWPPNSSTQSATRQFQLITFQTGHWMSKKLQQKIQIT